MISKFKNLSVKFKLILMMSIASAISLILVSSAVIFNETQRANTDTIKELTALADVVGWNSAAAMAFYDSEATLETLKALSNHSDIVATSLCDSNGKLFSQYISPAYTGKLSFKQLKLNAWQCNVHRQPSISSTFHLISREIKLQGESVGSIHIVYQQNALLKRLNDYYMLITSIAIISFLIVIVISTKLQRVFTTPLSELMQTMKSVSLEKKYNIRAKKISGDEYGTLVDVFNEMLNEIQQRDSQLGSYSQRLETKVAARTKDLYKKNQELQSITIEALQAKNIAEKANLVKSEFMATISHEIRTPMNGVLGMVEILLRSKLTEKQIKLLKTVQRSGKSLLIIINEILDFSKFESGKLALEKQAFRPHNLLHETLELFTEDAKFKGLILRSEFNIDEHLVLIGDKNRLQQIITNLLNNAIKFTAKGEVILRCSIPELAQAEFVHENDSKHIRLFFEVDDSGIGIPYEKQGIIFDSFSQVDSTTTREFGGTGLGLAICQQLVTLMGGDIGVNSSYGFGASFWFTATLELGDNDLLPQAATKHPCAQETAQFSATILVAEDNLVNQELAKTMLEILGCQVLLAGNGAEAIKIAARKPLDLIFMDCHMPQIDGFKATAHIRSQKNPALNFDQLPIIALTADIRQGIQKQCSHSGMNDYLSKPFTLNKLAEKLTQWLDTKQHLPPIITFKEADITGTGKAIEQKSWNVIQELQRPEQPDILHKLITIYLENTPVLIELLTQSASDMDAASFSETAHTIKSSSKNLGAIKLARLCEQAECNSKEKNQTRAFELINKIKQEYQLVEAELKEEISQKPAEI
ncbi:MAG: response regulator [Gammaproteobacteria bacterium]|nr:response regulator [Gammaproteobacteria bacterium]